MRAGITVSAMSLSASVQRLHADSRKAACPAPAPPHGHCLFERPPAADSCHRLGGAARSNMPVCVSWPLECRCRRMIYAGECRTSFDNSSTDRCASSCVCVRMLWNPRRFTSRTEGALSGHACMPQPGCADILRVRCKVSISILTSGITPNRVRCQPCRSLCQPCLFAMWWVTRKAPVPLLYVCARLCDVHSFLKPVVMRGGDGALSVTRTEGEGHWTHVQRPAPSACRSFGTMHAPQACHTVAACYF